MRGLLRSAVACFACLIMNVPVTGRATPQTAATTLSAAVFVASTGDDRGPGTMTQPWRTLQHAANLAVAGQTVNVRSGTYHEVLTISHSGSSTKGPIIFQSFPGEHAILDGTGQKLQNGEQRGLIAIHGSSNLTISNLELRNYRSNSVNSDPAGISIDGSGQSIKLLKNHIHDIETTAKGSSCTSGSGSTADAFGIVVYGDESTLPITNLVIDGNEVDDLRTGCSEALTINGNVANFSVTRNQVHDNDNIGIDIIGFEGVAPNPKSDQPRQGLVAGNHVFNISVESNPGYPAGDFSADGIYVDGGNNITVERNIIDHSDIGIEVASEARDHTSSQVILRNNLVFHNKSAGMSVGGYASDVGGSDHVTIVNNTLYENDTHQTGSGEFQVQQHATTTVFSNNIVEGGPQGLLVNSFVRTVAPKLDYNLYDVASAKIEPSWIYGGATSTTLASYRASSKQEVHSQFAPPGFINASGNDFSLGSASVALNRGDNLGASVIGTEDLAGNARAYLGRVDIGALQRKR
jgi:parallel beta-helix repeat protein